MQGMITSRFRQAYAMQLQIGQMHALTWRPVCVSSGRTNQRPVNMTPWVASRHRASIRTSDRMPACTEASKLSNGHDEQVTF